MSYINLLEITNNRFYPIKMADLNQKYLGFHAKEKQQFYQVLLVRIIARGQGSLYYFLGKVYKISHIIYQISYIIW